MEIRSKKIPLEIIKNHFLTYPKNVPNYFKNIPVLFEKNNPLSKTPKACSGVLNLYARSVSFTSPFDIQINFSGDKWKAFVGAGDLGQKTVTDVPYEQLFKYKDNGKYKAILKFNFGVTVQSKYPIHLNNPWWELNDFEIVPGVLNCKNPLELNFFMPIEKHVETLNITQGTALYLITSENNDKLKINFNTKPFNENLINGLQYKFSTLKDKFLGRKFNV
tara:strand:+ start:327 stop:986 length:660 start_codon:yes stop_codon:yes gene_type:complete